MLSDFKLLFYLFQNLKKQTWGLKGDLYACAKINKLVPRSPMRFPEDWEIEDTLMRPYRDLNSDSSGF